MKKCYLHGEVNIVEDFKIHHDNVEFVFDVFLCFSCKRLQTLIWL